MSDSMSEMGDRLSQENEGSDDACSAGRVLIYEDAPGDARVEVWVSRGGLWLSQLQMADLFERDRPIIAKHLNFAYRDGELDPKTTRTRIEELREEGGRTVTRGVYHYNLDAIMAVGFRIRSRRGIQFRSWAARLLREHLMRGYTLNPERILESGTEHARHSLARLDRAIERRKAAEQAR